MIIDKRRQTILSMLIKMGHVRVGDLAKQFGVSDDTIRRDLSALSEDGYLQKTHGGAVNLDVPGIRRELRSEIALEAKARIGETAVEHLSRGETVLFDAGLTVLEVAKRLPVGNFTVITLSLDVANVLSARTDIRLIVIGGEWDVSQRLMRGPTAIDSIKSYRADVLVTGACAIDPEYGVTASEEWDAAAKRAMISVSRRKLLVADLTKLGMREPYFVSRLENYDLFVSDDGLQSLT